MERTATMPMDEYEDLIKGLQSQTEIIKELKKQDHVVLVDERYNLSRDRNFVIPRIICGDDKAKQYLKEDYDRLNEQIQGLVNHIESKKTLKTTVGNTKETEGVAIIAFVISFLIGLGLGYLFF